MRALTLADLPPAPPGRSGWPWTEDTPPLPPVLPVGSPWPRVTVVTPSFNQARFLEETIRSVLLQGYPDLEYTLMDGGSTDGSTGIIERYAPWLAHWASEPDRGQSDAINRGLARATGEWQGWLNSDDCYAPGALRALIECAVQNGANFAVGASIRFRDGVLHAPTRIQPLRDAFDPATLRRVQGFDQPVCLWQRELFQQAGPLDESLHYGFDWQYFIRCAPLARVALSAEIVACYRVHEGHKTGTGGRARWQEVYQLYEQNLTGEDRLAFRRVRPWLPLVRWLKRMSQRYGRYGLYYGWRVPLWAIRRLVIERPPRLHPDSIAMLELPYAVPLRAQHLTRGPECDGTVAGALRAFRE